uniref:NADH dehydrogenase subunit 2 n=1 Tax=Holopristis ocellifer TaxID=1828400 RepID=UPI0021D52136|nr:NADH dehydrogenase subunit 2 [Hemigrammus ocellifer]UXD78993.1 NADH dehydrogenase subunit 2 [Hemigrammus ocellifer]
MPNTTRYMMLTSLGSGTIITFLAEHWLLAWIGLEINSLAFLPLMAQQNHPRATEATTKYFLIQSTASALLLFATALNAWTTGQWNIYSIENQIATYMIFLALAMKLGLAPFHFWPVEVMQGLNLKTALILTTWQKLAPFALLMQIYQTINPFLLTTVALTSALAAALAGLNQTQLRKILAYSSTAHLAWVVVIIQYMPDIALFTLMIYIISTMAAFLTLMESSTMKINTLTLMWSKNATMVVTLALILLSLAGLPPLTGFSPKLLIIEELTKQEMIISTALLAMSSLISLFFYVRLCYFSTITLFPSPLKREISWRRTLKQNKIPTATAISAATILLPLMPLFLP